MDTLQSMKVFRLVAELKSFAAAADRLGISPAMASKHVQHLEQRLSTRLLNRTSRSVSLSEAGMLYFEQSRLMLDTLDEVEAEVSQATVVPRGTLKLNAPEFMANPVFVNVLADYQQRYPEVQLDIDLNLRSPNIIDQGFDLALRIKDVQTSQPGLIERSLMNISFHLVAAPGYLDKYGRPQHIDDLNGKHMLIHNQSALTSTHSYSDGTGSHTLKFSPVLQSDNIMLLHQAVLQGMGMTFMPKFLIKEDLAAKRLELLLPENAKFETTICGVYPSRKFLSAKVKTFLEFIAADSRFS